MQREPNLVHWTLLGHQYTGPYNPFDKQLSCNRNTGEILAIWDQPTSSTDAIAMQHDLDYNVCKDDRKFKNEADRKMTDHLMQFHVGIDNGDIAINAINTKRNLVLVFRKTEKAIELATTIS